MKKTIITVAFALLLTESLLAIDAMDMQNFIYLRDSGIVLPHLHPIAGIDYISTSTDKTYDREWDKEDIYGTYKRSVIWYSIGFGLGDMFETRLFIPTLTHSLESDYPTVRKDESSGASDIWLTTKFAFIQKPYLSFRFGVKFPTGDDNPPSNKLPTGDGQTDLDFSILSAYQPEQAGVAYNVSVGYRLRFEQEESPQSSGYDFDPADEGHFALYIGGKPVEYFGILFGGNGFISTSDDRISSSGFSHNLDDTWRAYFQVGTIIKGYSPVGVNLRADFHFDVAGKNEPAGFTWGVGVEYIPKFY